MEFFEVTNMENKESDIVTIFKKRYIFKNK